MTTRSFRLMLGVAASAAVLSGTVLAERAGAGLSRECKREVVKLCGLSGIRSCLTEKYQSLSDGCRTAILSIAAHRAGDRQVRAARAS